MKLFKFYIKEGMFRIFKIRANLAIFLSLLIISVFTMYALSAVTNFYKYNQAVEGNLELTADRLRFLIKNEFKKDWVKLTASEVVADKESQLTTFRIMVKQDDIDSLNIDLPESGKDHYVDAFMHVSDRKNETFKVKLRYRGDSNYHWLYKQKSLRIKLSGNDVYNMSKKFNLINGQGEFSYRSSIEYDLARELGLISLDYKPSRVFINGKYMGVYIYQPQVDESLLRSERVMPGSIYSGDGSPLDKNGVADLWNNEKYWKKNSSRNLEQKENREDIELFINSVNGNNFNNFVETYLDKNKFFTFIAMDRVFGSHHHDYIHNHKIYFDPYKGKFEPISWDLRFWLPHKKKDLSLYPLQLKLSENPIYDAEIDRIAFHIINNNLLEYIDKSYTNILKSIERDLRSDVYKDRVHVQPWMSMKGISQVLDMSLVLKNKEDSLNVIKNRIKFLDNLYNDTTIQTNIVELPDGRSKLTMIINGTAPVVPHKINPYLDKDIVLYPGRQIVDNSQDLFNPGLYGNKTVQNVPAKYEFFVNSSLSKVEVENILFKNYITGKEILSTELFELNDYKNIRKGKIESKNTSTEILKGVVEVKNSLIFDEFTSVTIEPNTTFILNEKASIYFYGKVIAIGEKDKPIRFIAKDSNKPWGLVAVQGQGTTGSKFEYVEFENGSIDTRNLINYTAPFNIHDTDWFEVRNCKIGRNFIGDDAMHVAYAKGVIENCEFKDARSDGLDIDIADVTVRNNVFYNSGNDGLDIMTTKMKASGNVFIDTGDKGISVGEWSEADITNSIFLRTVIGLEVKDKSTVTADNLLFVDSTEKAINLYNKNSRYDEGGLLEGGSIVLLGNDLITADVRSEFNITDKQRSLDSDNGVAHWLEEVDIPFYREIVKDGIADYAQ